MKASSFYELSPDPVECKECGKLFYDKEVPDKSKLQMHRKRKVDKWTQLAGHILAREDHPDKRWAKHKLHDAGVGFMGWFR